MGGFGSMPVGDKEALLNNFSRAIQRAGMRGIFCSGWADTENITVPENVLLVTGAPHEWLLPRCSIAIHHGGAGTTAASLRAGILTIIFPILVDHPFWASRVVKLQVGQNEVCMLRDLTEEKLYEQIAHCQKDEIRTNARVLGEELRKEDGTFEAASYIVSYAQKRRNPGLSEMRYQQDRDAPECTKCKKPFTLFFRRHHCLSCGDVCCSNCVKYFDLVNYETWKYC